MNPVKTLLILFSLGAALGSVSSCALPHDSEQPIRVQADEAQLDDKQGIATYRGDVVITQGSMILKGSTVTLTRTQDGALDVVTSVGNLAYFEQKQKATDLDPVRGYGKTIQYQAQQNRIILIDQAKVTKEGNTTEGEKIIYDTVKQVATAGRANGTSITTPRERIDMVIQPKKITDEHNAQ